MANSLPMWPFVATWDGRFNATGTACLINPLLPQAADDAAAATAGVPIGGSYANGSAVMQRQT